MMKYRKFLLSLMTGIITAGLLVGCNGKKDEQEPDPTEEPSEEKDNQ